MVEANTHIPLSDSVNGALDAIRNDERFVKYKGFRARMVLRPQTRVTFALDSSGIVHFNIPTKFQSLTKNQIYDMLSNVLLGADGYYTYSAGSAKTRGRYKYRDVRDNEIAEAEEFRRVCGIEIVPKTPLIEKQLEEAMYHLYDVSYGIEDFIATVAILVKKSQDLRRYPVAYTDPGLRMIYLDEYLFEKYKKPEWLITVIINREIGVIKSWNKRANCVNLPALDEYALFPRHDEALWFMDMKGWSFEYGNIPLSTVDFDSLEKDIGRDSDKDGDAGRELHIPPCGQNNRRIRNRVW